MRSRVRRHGISPRLPTHIHLITSHPNLTYGVFMNRLPTSVFVTLAGFFSVLVFALIGCGLEPGPDGSGDSNLLLDSATIDSGVEDADEVVSPSSEAEPMYRVPLTGTRRVLVLIPHFEGEEGPRLSREAARAQLDRVSEIYATNSYGRLNLEFDIAPIINLRRPSSSYENAQPYPVLTRLRPDVLKAAEALGYNTEDYDRELIFMRKLWMTGWSGFADNGRTAIVTCDCPYLTAHELGHTQLWAHAGFQQGTPGAPFTTQGPVYKYGDVFDPMGSVWNTPFELGLRHFGPAYKLRTGWLRPEEVQSITRSGEYTIGSLHRAPGEQPAALRIRRAEREDLWIFLRGDEPTVRDGVMITRMGYSNRDHSWLVDTTPGSREGRTDAYDAQLTVGRSIYDPEAGCTIELVSVSTEQARVRVTVDEGAAMRTLGQPAEIGALSPRIGRTVSGVHRYEFTAHDPDVGTENGAGISQVTLYFVPAPGSAGTGGGGEGEGGIQRRDFVRPPYALTVDTREHPDGMSWLRIQVQAEDGGDNRASLHHLVNNTGPSF